MDSSRLPSSQTTDSGRFGSPNASSQVSPLPHNPSLSSAHSCSVSLTTTPRGSTLPHYNRPLQHHGGRLSNAAITPTASSNSQVLVGGIVFNFASSPMSILPGSNEPPSSNSTGALTKPFVLKLKTNQIRLCQSCWKDYGGPNDTMGLVVARAERRLVSNLVTGTQFVGRESNSHYHLHMTCLKLAQPSFTGEELVIPDEVKSKLTAFQKMYLITYIQVPSQSLWLFNSWTETQTLRTQITVLLLMYYCNCISITLPNSNANWCVLDIHVYM